MKTFNDIEFSQNSYDNGWYGVLELGDYTLSVVAAKHAYSQPREYLMHVEDYSKFEVAVIRKGEFVTREIFPNELDDVLAYQTKEEINHIIKQIAEHAQKKSN